MTETGRLGLVVVLLAASFAGCVGVGSGDEVEANATDAADLEASEAGGDLENASNAALSPEDRIEGPSWEVGQWFGYHVFFGVNDTEGTHYNSAVVSEDASSWLLAPEDATLSKLEAAFDLPFLGTFDKNDLSTTEGGEPFQWYDWPLFDGKNYTEEVEWGGETYEVHFEVSYEEAISTKDGEHPGFSIVGETTEGERYIEYDYVPHVGWFAHLFLYPLDGETDDDWQFHIMTMGAGENWTGTAYVDEETLLLEHLNIVAPPSTVEPSPHGSFTVSSEATHVVGFAWSGAYTGAHETLLVDPNQTTHSMEAAAGPTSFNGSFQQIIQPAVPGDWEVATAGAGLFAGGGVTIWETIETAYELEDGEPVEG